MRIFLITLFCSSAVVALPEKIDLAVGTQVTLRKDFSGSATVTNARVARISVSSNSVKIMGLKTGVTHFIQGTRQSEIVVFHSKLSPLKKQIEAFLDSNAQLIMEVEPKNILLSGKVLRLSDWKALSLLASKHLGFLELHVHPTLALAEEIAAGAKREIQARSLDAEVATDGGEVQIFSHAKDKKVLNELAQRWGLRSVIESQSLDLKPMIEVNVIIAEVRKQDLNKVGLQLPGKYSATLIPSGDLSSVSTSYGPVQIDLNALISSGKNKVLANPKLLCRSGEKARFVAGGEIPIKIANWKRSDVLWKTYGVILNIEPLADRQGAISSKLSAEVSLLDEAHTVDGLPGLFTNRIETHFDLKGNQTIVLSGLIKTELGRSSQGVPLLSSIPILGDLFQSEDYRNHHTELVVFVTPRVVTAATEPPPKIPFKWGDE